jgi:hypothetical protein
MNIRKAFLAGITAITTLTTPAAAQEGRDGYVASAIYDAWFQSLLFRSKLVTPEGQDKQPSEQFFRPEQVTDNPPSKAEENALRPRLFKLDPTAKRIPGIARQAYRLENMLAIYERAKKGAKLCYEHENVNDRERFVLVIATGPKYEDIIRTELSLLASEYSAARLKFTCVDKEPTKKKPQKRPQRKPSP